MRRAPWQRWFLVFLVGTMEVATRVATPREPGRVPECVGLLGASAMAFARYFPGRAFVGMACVAFLGLIAQGVFAQATSVSHWPTSRPDETSCHEFQDADSNEREADGDSAGHASCRSPRNPRPGGRRTTQLQLPLPALAGSSRLVRRTSGLVAADGLAAARHLQLHRSRSYTFPKRSTCSTECS